MARAPDPPCRSRRCERSRVKAVSPFTRRASTISGTARQPSTSSASPSPKIPSRRNSGQASSSTGADRSQHNRSEAKVARRSLPEGRSEAMAIPCTDYCAAQKTIANSTPTDAPTHHPATSRSMKHRHQQTSLPSLNFIHHPHLSRTEDCADHTLMDKRAEFFGNVALRMS